MKVRARKLLSLFLTLAMVAGMFVLPASAATAMVLDMGTCATMSITAGSKTEPHSNVLDSNFTYNAGEKDTIARDKSYKFSDNYSATKAIKLNGGSNKSGNRRTLNFTTTETTNIKV